VRVKNSKKIKPEIEEISKEFVTENKEQILKFNNRKKGGPYSKHEKEKRRNEVYRLHFEYGYSARKIAEFMKVNRNTINVDINYWYSNILKRTDIFQPEYAVIITLQRFEIQRSRLREKIDQCDSAKETIALERLIYDIDSKIVYTLHRLAESQKRMMDYSTDRINDWYKDNGKNKRCMNFFDRVTVSKIAKEKIDKIFKEDHSHFFEHKGQRFA